MAKTKEKESKFDYNNIQELSKQSIHFSFKYKNSQIQPGGIRLSKEDCLYGTNYVALSTLLNDYDFNGMVDVVSMRLLNGAFDFLGGMHTTLNNSENDNNYTNKFKTYNMDHFEINTDNIDTKFTQLLLPSGEDYKSVTPLTPAGFYAFCSSLQTVKNVKRLNLNVGGTQKQNVGKFAASGKDYAYVANAPFISNKIYKLWYRGFIIRINYSIAKKYSSFLQLNNLTDSNHFKQNELLFLKKIVDDIFINSNFIKTELLKHKDKLKISDDLQFSKKCKNKLILDGIINKNHQNELWKSKFADLIIKKLQRLNNKSKEPLFNLDSIALEKLKQLLISEVL